MDEIRNEDNRPVNPRRRKRDPIKTFKEAYLPLIIAGAALVLIVIFIIGSISRGAAKRKESKSASAAAASALAESKQQLDAEAQNILLEAEALASQYNYAGAVALIDSFSGSIADYPELTEKRDAYAALQEQMVAWADPNQVVNLSFHLLIADPERAYVDSTYGDAYKRNFVTTSEFSKILQQLYDNGYILVNLSDFITTNVKENGEEELVSTPLYLPEGKKPLILTETNVNYYSYMVDIDRDGTPDKDGAGFASRLMLDDSGKITCEMVDADGNTVTGNYDLVPILDAFIEEHPDFSYNGAKAILAVTGYDGLFGYRTNSSVKTSRGQEYYDAQVQGATQIVQALRADGYTLACYSYENIAYGNASTDTIKQDLANWNSEVTPILGTTDILVYTTTDIAVKESVYSGSSYTALQEAGFRYFLGFCDSASPWTVLNGNCFRQGRLLVTGSSLTGNASLYEGLFDASTVLDPARGS